MSGTVLTKRVLHTEPRWPIAIYDTFDITDTGLIQRKTFTAVHRLIAVREFDIEELDGHIEELLAALDSARAVFFKPAHERRG
jgi:hypothetical protein